MTVSGIDVANYQDSAYNTAGLDFVVVKATEGTSYINPKHSAQVATARTHGLVVAHYHFARPGSVTAQADHFLEHAGARPGDFLVYDWEDPGVSTADKDAWLRYVQAKAPGHRVVLYCNRDFWINRDTTSYCADGLWIADPSAPAGHPRVQHPWLFHQYSSAGGLDRDLGQFADRTALAAWAAGTATPQHQEDDMLSLDEIAKAVWAHSMLSPTSRQSHSAETFLRYQDAHHAQLTAQVAALTAAVTALAKGGGLTAAEITAAAEAGAQAALAQLADALTNKEN
jgi:hypothetical protein